MWPQLKEIPQSIVIHRSQHNSTILGHETAVEIEKYKTVIHSGFCLGLNGHKACVQHTKGNQVTVGTSLCFVVSWLLELQLFNWELRSYTVLGEGGRGSTHGRQVGPALPAWLQNTQTVPVCKSNHSLKAQVLCCANRDTVVASLPRRHTGTHCKHRCL